MKTILKRRPGAAKSEAAQKRTATITGAAVLGFALVGVITVISLLVSLLASFFDNSKQKEMFAQFIKPVVMVDPVAFSSVSNADEHVLLMSSMWNLLMNVGEDTAYPEDEYGMIIVPASDLDVSAANLFGSEAKLSHQTFGNTSITFEYNAENSSYIVPPMGYSMQYEPRIEKIKRRGKIYTLTVAYISTNTGFNQAENQEDYDKLMYYELQKTGKDKYIIRSIADTEDKSQNTSSQNTSSKAESSGISKTESSNIAVSEQ